MPVIKFKIRLQTYGKKIRKKKRCVQNPGKKPSPRIICVMWQEFPQLSGTLPLQRGWKIGLEPTTFGTTIRRSDLLSYIHHLLLRCKGKENL